ncbi:TenA family transcriptional regulator [Caldimonas brevitalea]|uniref:Iron-containing redox enzyme family protein n=1 Tax=Caldimonas brevitalea TaxID=413882 RepID=A0A0G3BC13_9BURK|nr:iron-containing redox enzyme family protein [Caldimonas brevitalea]AKJ26899.1 hypothetical protein AAW51_0208 [Caldimonas brevitalea]
MNLQIETLEATKLALIERTRKHSFLARCRAGTVTLDELKLMLVQQGLYSTYFTRYLCAMMANLPSNQEVLALAENLFEELGLAPDSPRPHYLIYRDMLEHFGLTLERARPLPGTRQLIDAMFANCRDPNPARGLGALCLGAEALVPAVYSDILAGFSACGAQPEELEFFRIHVECDDGHAETIRDIMVQLAAGDNDQIDQMLEAGRHLVDARLAFFSSIETAHHLAWVAAEPEAA